MVNKMVKYNFVRISKMVKYNFVRISKMVYLQEFDKLVGFLCQFLENAYFKATIWFKFRTEWVCHVWWLFATPKDGSLQIVSATEIPNMALTLYHKWTIKNKFIFFIKLKILCGLNHPILLNFAWYVVKTII